MLCQKGVLKNFAIFTRKNLCWCLFLIKVAGLKGWAYQKSGTETLGCYPGTRTLWWDSGVRPESGTATSIFSKNLFFICLFFIRITRSSKTPLKWAGVQKQSFVDFCKINILNNFAKFTGKHLCCSLVFRLSPVTLLKKASAQVSSCEFCKIFKNTIFTEHLRMTASGNHGLLYYYTNYTRPCGN